MKYCLSTLFFSPTGNTAKITKAVAEGFGKSYVEYDLTTLKNRRKYEALSFNKHDLVIIGVPVYRGRIPEFLVDFFQRFIGNEAKAVFTLVYGERAYEDALVVLKNTFEKAGFKGVAAASFIGEHSYTNQIAGGRPDTDDLGIAFQLGHQVKARLDVYDELSQPELFVKGNFPYKEITPSPTIVPETNDDCTDCGICASVCPMEAIDFVNFRTIDATKCILCSNCIKKCPENAKAINHEFIVNFTQNLISKLAEVRNEPELFF